MRVTDHIRERLHARLGLSDPPPKIHGRPSLDRLRATEWSHEFERLQRNRMLMGSLRYGRLGAEGKPQYDRCADIKRRIQAYEDTGNQEFLVDAANLCQCEFVEGVHPQKHFASLDDGEHSQEV